VWADLRGDDPSKAWRGVWALAGAPKQSLPLLSKHLRPAPTLTSEQRQEAITRLKELDHRRYPVREKASREILKFGESVLPLVKGALADNPPLDLRRRLEEVLETLSNPPRDPAQLQALRAVEVLEHIGNDDARQLLEKLAAG